MPGRGTKCGQKLGSWHWQPAPAAAKRPPSYLSEPKFPHTLLEVPRYPPPPWHFHMQNSESYPTLELVLNNSKIYSLCIQICLLPTIPSNFTFKLRKGTFLRNAVASLECFGSGVDADSKNRFLLIPKSIPELISFWFQLSGSNLVNFWPDSDLFRWKSKVKSVLK